MPDGGQEAEAVVDAVEGQQAGQGEAPFVFEAGSFRRLLLVCDTVCLSILGQGGGSCVVHKLRMQDDDNSSLGLSR